MGKDFNIYVDGGFLLQCVLHFCSLSDIHHLITRNAVLELGGFDSFLGVIFKGKISSAWFPSLPLHRPCDLYNLSLACHRICKLVPGFFIAFSGKGGLYHCSCCNLAKLLCLFTHTVGEQTQLSLQHYSGYKEFYLNIHSFITLCINDKEHYSNGNVVGVLLSNTLANAGLTQSETYCGTSEKWSLRWPLRTVDLGAFRKLQWIFFPQKRENIGYKIMKNSSEENTPNVYLFST